MSDIEFGAGETLYVNWWTSSSNGGLATLSTSTAALTPASILKFGDNPFDPDTLLANGALSEHPSGGLWAIESGDSEFPTLFPVANNGLAGTVVRVGLNGEAADFGADAMEILADGRFVVLGTSLASGGGLEGLFFIDPVADSTSGLAELTEISLDISWPIQGKLNGLTLMDQPGDPGSTAPCFRDSQTACLLDGLVGNGSVGRGSSLGDGRFEVTVTMRDSRTRPMARVISFQGSSSSTTARAPRPTRR